VRRLNLDKLCAMLGTTWLLKRDRQHADRVRGERLTALQEEPKQRHQKAQELRRSNGSANNDAHTRPPPTGDPPERPDGMKHIGTLLDPLLNR